MHFRLTCGAEVIALATRRHEMVVTREGWK